MYGDSMRNPHWEWYDDDDDVIDDDDDDDIDDENDDDDIGDDDDRVHLYGGVQVAEHIALPPMPTLVHHLHCNEQLPIIVIRLIQLSWFFWSNYHDDLPNINVDTQPSCWSWMIIRHDDCDHDNHDDCNHNDCDHNNHDYCDHNV